MAKTQGIRLDPETQDRLKWLAERRDRSMNYLIKEAVGRYLEDEERFVRERFERERIEDNDRLEHFLETGEHISHSQIKQKLDQLLSKARQAAS